MPRPARRLPRGRHEPHGRDSREGPGNCWPTFSPTGSPHSCCRVRGSAAARRRDHRRPRVERLPRLSRRRVLLDEAGWTKLDSPIGPTSLFWFERVGKRRGDLETAVADDFSDVRPHARSESEAGLRARTGDVPARRQSRVSGRAPPSVAGADPRGVLLFRESGSPVMAASTARDRSDVWKRLGGRLAGWPAGRRRLVAYHTASAALVISSSTSVGRVAKAAWLVSSSMVSRAWIR
ncbi:MAG: hypothetical protein JWN32_163 [Solirubrobacterales bacterium]|nr:hypothetical protein [Solirubrobacterales bacterium]